MLNWLKQAIGGKNVALTPELEAWIKNLRSILEGLKTLKNAPPGFADNLVNYILQGEPVLMLQEIGKLPPLSSYVGMTHRNVEPARIAFYQSFNRVPPPIALRWAKVLEKISNVANSRYTIPIPGAAHWPEVLMMNAAGRDMYSWTSNPPKVRGLHADQMEALLVEDGLLPSALLTSSFSAPVNSGYMVVDRLGLVTQLEGYADHLQRHIEAVRPLLLTADVDRRVMMLGLLNNAHDATLALLANELADMGTSNSKQVRAASEPLIRRVAPALVDRLKQLAIDAKPEQRGYALRLLWDPAQQRGDADVMAFARQAAEADKSQNVRALLQEWDHRDELASRDGRKYEYTMPVVDWDEAPAPPLLEAIAAFFVESNRIIDKTNQSNKARFEALRAQGHKHARFHEHPSLLDSYRRDLVAYLAKAGPGSSGDVKLSHWHYVLRDAITRLFAHPDMTPVQLVKICDFLFRIKNPNASINYNLTSALGGFYARAGAPDLLTVSALLNPFGVTDGDILNSYCSTSDLSSWAAADAWPFFAHNIELVNHTLLHEKGSYSFDRAKLFKAISLLPWPHENTVNVLFDLALGTTKAERLDAQKALNNHPGKEVRIMSALGNGKAEVRTIAAKWLQDIDCRAAIADLEAAVAKEKNDVAKGAMLDALQRFGQPVEKYLDRAALKKEAAKTLAKGLPKDIEWFPWSAMPAVRWADNGEQVAEDVLRLLLAQSVKQKSPEPNAVLRKFCGMFEERDRERFGQFVLEAWIRQDTLPVPAPEAERRAHAQAIQMHGWLQSSPQYFQGSPHLGKTVEELYAFYLPGQLRQPAGTAIASKGVLAVAAACAAERAAAPVGRYLKEFYGTRAAHGKALIAMLAWVEHPSATQLMLSVGSRFRTKSFQEEATRQAEALAERKGWTLAELADRTIPSGGFDETSTLELSYGERSFTAKLLPDFKIELFNPEDKKVAALSEPRMDDDADQAKASKQALSAAKKEIKSIVTLQSERLYEALCTERSWTYADWEAYLNKHAIVRRLIQRLVWVQVGDGEVRQSFRPLDDGTLTDVEDNEVALPDDARVRLAHDSLLTPEQVAAWQTHLADYEVVPLFQQLGKGTYSLPEDRANNDNVKDYEGHLLEAFALRGRATKLGYSRGAAEDGGWFYTYEKRFPTLGIIATVEFTGNGLPEENRTVALLALGFRSTEDKGWQRFGMKLGTVPKVLLSECYNDLRLMAADGSGFDAEWEAKSSP